ncbi:MAG: hypothetical protein AAF658_04150 [Myxococcota bacterium]
MKKLNIIGVLMLGLTACGGSSGACEFEGFSGEWCDEAFDTEASCLEVGLSVRFNADQTCEDLLYNVACGRDGLFARSQSTCNGISGN